MIIEPLSVSRIGEVIALMRSGEPHITPRTWSDYWLYATLFSATCPLAILGGRTAGAVIAFRSQDNPADIYVQDVVTHPDYRRRGVTRPLIDMVADRGTAWGCRRMYLTSEPENVDVHHVWTAMGFTNVPGDHTVGFIDVHTDYKGPGRTRAVYERLLPTVATTIDSIGLANLPPS